MEDFIENLIKSNSSNLLKSDGTSLRETVKSLEHECKTELGDQINEQELYRYLRLRLIKTSLSNQNIKLALLIIAKLKLTQLALILKSTLSFTQDETSQLLTFVYIGHYFQHEKLVLKFVELIKKVQQQKNDLDSSPNHDTLNKLYIDCGQWNEAFRWSEIQSVDDEEELLNQKQISFKLALHNEIDEEYSDALDYYEKSNTAKYNSTRSLIKQFNKSAYTELKNYCLTHPKLRNFFIEYSYNCDIIDNFHLYQDLLNNLTPLRVIISINSEPRELEEKILSSLPNKMRDFILDTSSEKWLNKQKLDSMLSMGAALIPSSSHPQLAWFAFACHKGSCSKKASSICLVLNQQEVALNLMTKNLNRHDGLELTIQRGSMARISEETEDFLNSKESNPKNDFHSRSKTSRILFNACLKLGILNEALLAFKQDPNKDEKTVNNAINYLETCIEERHSGCLANINPILPPRTFKIISVLLQERNKIITTGVINIIILALTITIYKFQANSMEQDELYITRLESMFLNAADYFQRSNFHTSSSLLRAINSLITVVKDKLEALSDCDNIRIAFKQIIESTANKCMTGSQYKSAAMLYSKLEDNVSAVKSLMRLGEVEVVIDYSLLVQDLTVNRLTINYLKHLKVDPSIVEDFINQSKSSSS